jgi:hypothetical protein
MPSEKKNLSQFQMWFEEAWEGWIRPLGAILLLAAGYLLYKFDILGERPAGVIAVLAIVLGAVASGALAAWPLARVPGHRALVVTAALLITVAALYPALHAALPSAVLAEATLTPDKLSADLTTGGDGPYDVTVSGRLKASGNQEASESYDLKAVDNAGTSDEVKGAITRHYVTIRSRKGSSSSLQERNENTHRLPHLRGPKITVSVDGLDEEIEGGLNVALRKGSLSPLIFIVLGALALLLALILDARLKDAKDKLKSYLTATFAIAFAFGMYYPDEATPHALVRPAVSGLLFALVVGGLSGWLVSAVVKLAFGPKVKKAAARR